MKSIYETCFDTNKYVKYIYSNAPLYIEMKETKPTYQKKEADKTNSNYLEPRRFLEDNDYIRFCQQKYQVRQSRTLDSLLA